MNLKAGFDTSENLACIAKKNLVFAERFIFA